MRALRKGSYRSEQGTAFGTPKEIWGFRTSPSAESPRTIARNFLAAHAALLGLDSGGDELEHDVTLSSVGAHHVIFRQCPYGIPAHRGFVTVHIDRSGRVYLAKNRAVPPELLPTRPEFRVSLAEAEDLALRKAKVTRRTADVRDRKRMWFFRDDTEKLHEAIRVRIVARKPRKDWIVFVNARTKSPRILSANDNLCWARGRGRVFDPHPVAALGDWKLLFTQPKKIGTADGWRYLRKPPPEAYVDVALEGLVGNGKLDGRRVTTSPTRDRIVAADGDFRLYSKQKGFEEVMCYFHLDRAIRYLEALGYEGPRAIFTRPLAVDVNGTTEDDAHYSPGEQMLTIGTGGVDCGEDGETILHEFGHALQDRICPGFGQSDEAAAMGEGFGDYLAASFFADKKTAAYRTSVMSWDAINWDQGFDPPALRRVDSKRTFAGFKVAHGCHENGTIWSATLWDVREELGRDKADRLIVESHFQLDGHTRFHRGARAILDADDNLFAGVHRKALERIFAQRKIGPLR